MKARVGVFVCNCGTNIGGVINVADVVKYASQLDGVVFAEEGKWICSVDYLSKIKENIEEHKLNRVVVACCTPRTHEPTFKSTIKEAGLNPYLLEFVSIREQSSWVHKNNPKLATEKAKDLVRMGVAKAILLEPGEDIRISVGKNCLIIGGGLAGMTAALAVADQGFKVNLIEKNSKPGGILNKLDTLAPFGIDAKEIVNAKIQEITKHDNIRVHTDTELERIDWLKRRTWRRTHQDSIQRTLQPDPSQTAFPNTGESHQAPVPEEVPRDTFDWNSWRRSCRPRR